MSNTYTIRGLPKWVIKKLKDKAKKNKMTIAQVIVKTLEESDKKETFLEKSKKHRFRMGKKASLEIDKVVYGIGKDENSD